MHVPSRKQFYAPMLLLALAAAQAADAGTKLLRFPDIHGGQLVFCYAGDLWRAPATGGLATRLTAHPGLEVFPKFSPDGQQVAFTGQYDGDEQVYAVSAIGGVPRQLTYYPAQGPLPDRWGFDNQVYGWTVDGKSVLFRSMRHAAGLTDTRLYTVSLDGGLPQALPMRVSGAGDISPDGRYVVFSPLVRDFRTWKRYEGGWAQDLFIFNLTTGEYEQITDHPRSDRDPMWIGNRIYFSSDRSGTLNLYYYDVAARNTRQVTRHEQHDVRWPSKGAQQIVYELAGELHVLSTDSGQSKKIDIQVPDDGLAERPRRVSAASNISGYGLSPKAERALVVARGDVFTLPIEKGLVRNLTKSSQAHDKAATWSPDGSSIAFISDRDGEEELYVVDQKGTGETTQLTDGGAAMRYAPRWSSDGKYIAFSDKDGKVWVLEVATKKLSEVADEARGQVSDYMWSPHGGHLAMSLSDENGMNSIYIWSVSDRKLRRITDELFHEYEPVWDPDGKYLYYFSDREFAPQIGSVEWNYVRDRETCIMALALQKDTPHPYPPENDEVTVGKDQDDKDDKDKENGDEADEDEDKDEEDDDASVQIDFDGLAQRVTPVPVEAENYGNLNAVDGHLLYVRQGPFYYGRESDAPPELIVFCHEDREEEVLAEDISGYALSHNGKHALVRSNGKFQLYDIGNGDDPKTISTSHLMVNVVPKQEWDQIFDEVWRRFRDFFYVQNLHGYDWDALRKQYRPLLQYVAHRSDLNYVIGEMIAELSVGHAYKAGGDFTRPKRPDVALPGALLELDQQANRFRIAKIYVGHNEESSYRSPLTEIGVDASVGDYILAIDGEELTGQQNPYELLRFKSSQPVTFTVNSKPSLDGAREVTFHPIDDESPLVYLNWVLGNLHKVREATNGKIGYMHIPDMGEDGIREFNKWYYGQIRQAGLIVDVRSNGGGNVSQMLIERLGRELLATGFARTSDTPSTYPDTVFHGHLVCLLDEDSASDGDIFPAMFRQAGLGPLIGKRSWGGVIGITNRGTLIDGGTVFVPEFGFSSTDGKWIIEGYGVDPDIEVENDPKSLIEGRDPQLERAIKEITRLVTEDPKQLPSRPAPPVKTK